VQHDLKGITYIGLSFLFDLIKSEPGQKDHQHDETAGQNY
jgi:hypothetical protein